MLNSSFDKIQWLGIIFSLIILVSVVWLVRERLIKEKYSLVWFLIGLLILIMSMCRGLLEGFSALVGIEYAPSALFSLLIAFSYLLLLNLSVSVSGLKTHTKDLSQELGLLKLKVEELEQERAKNGP